MRLVIFNVEHGACALITTSNGRRIMIDAGHNSSTQWYPGNYLRAHGITGLDKLCITNYDEDHVSGLPNLFDQIEVSALYRNPTVSASDLYKLKTEDGMGGGIARLASAMHGIFTGGPPADDNNGDTVFDFFWNLYPTHFDDENNLSLVVFVHAGSVKLVFPGDVEIAGWRTLLRNPAFCSRLQNVNLFVASHHGRESGYCREVFDYCSPQAVIVSDSTVKYDTQKVASLYRQYTSGVNSANGQRHVLTTRRDGWMVIENGANGSWNLQLENGGR